MKFSIIVPVYNVEKYLNKCLDSILKQQYKDFEIIAVNDGSNDNSFNILKEYESKYSCIKVISQENLGLGGARNTGIKSAKGDYLVFIDSDDYVDENMLFEINEILCKDDIDILAFDGYRVTENGVILDELTNKDFSDTYNEISRKQFLLFEPTGCTKIYKTKLFVENDIYFPEHLWYEDLATVFKLILVGERFIYLKRKYYYYVQQSNSITHSSNFDRMMEIIVAFEEEINFYKNMDSFKKYYTELEWNCFLHVLYYSAYRIFICGYKKKYMKKLYSYAKKTFPNIENNKYIQTMLKEKYDMDLILKKRYFKFYLHTGFFKKYGFFLRKIKSIIRK